MHPAVRISFRHLLVHNPASCSHPLHIAGRKCAFVAQTVAMIDRSGKYIRNGFYSTVRMPRETCKIIFRTLVAEIIKKEERIEFGCFSEAECALQLYSRPFKSRLGLNNLFYRS